MPDYVSFYAYICNITSNTSLMKKAIFICAAAILTMGACQKTKNDGSTQQPSQLADLPADSSIYGKATDNFGMSTFAIMTDEGKEIELMRTHEDGEPAQFYGDVKPGDRYAVTLAENGTSVDCALNMTQLEAIATDFKVWNAQLILQESTKTDTVSIVRLDADSLVAKGRTTYRFGRNK